MCKNGLKWVFKNYTLLTTTNMSKNIKKLNNGKNATDAKNDKNPENAQNAETNRN